jgi:hypothetical protein
MIMFWTGLFVGIFIGVFVGVSILALCFVAGGKDEDN